MSSPIDSPPLALAQRQLLVLDAPGPARERLAHCLTAAGATVVICSSVAEANAALAGPEAFDLALAEVTTGGRALIDVVARPDLVLLDSFGTAEDHAIDRQRGAARVLARPLADSALTASLEELLKARPPSGSPLAGFDSQDPRMRAVLELAARVAPARTNVLIQGESGTGKTRLARALHAASPRARAAFVEINCGALPEALLMSELFGHKKGAFTGADTDRVGKFAAADGGTLFLDEIATASPDLQVKLLRVLESGCFEPVGSNATVEVDVRVLAACNVALEDEVAAGRFREDLYWRLHVVAIDVPPLRERPGDLIALAERFQVDRAKAHGRELGPLSPICQALLVAHDWPGNVRELENVIERAVLLSRGPALAPEDFGERFRPALEFASPASSNTTLPPEIVEFVNQPPGPLKSALQAPEAYLVRRALEASGGHRKRTAALLDINRSTLFNKMRQYGLTDFPLVTEEEGTR